MVQKMKPAREAINQLVFPLDQFKEIFSDFEKQGIRYCLLRNFEFLFDLSYTPEGLDTVIAKEDYQKARTILLQHGFTQRKPQFSLQHKAFFKIVHGFKVSFDVQVGGIYWNDMKYMDESILFNLVKRDFFYVPSDNDTFLMLLVHSILGKRRFKPKYQQILTSLLEQGKLDENKITQELTIIFTNKRAKELLALVKAKQFGAVQIYSYLGLFIFKSVKHIATFSALSLRWIKWKRPLMPAPLISIVGPDGAGKSTLVSSLEIFLQKNRRKTAVVYMGRGRNNILPFTTLGRKYKSAEKKRDAVKKSGKIALKRKILYSGASILFAIDSLLRYWLIVFPLRMRKKIVITDRYCSDIILMKNVPFWWKRWWYSLFPKPSISVLLHNTPEILHQRRPEESIAELQRQMIIFNQLRYDLRLETKNMEEDKRKVLDFVTSRLLIDWY